MTTQLLLTIKDAAVALSVSPKTIRRLIAEADTSASPRWRWGRELVNLAPTGSSRRMVRVDVKAVAPYEADEKLVRNAPPALSPSQPRRSRSRLSASTIRSQLALAWPAPRVPPSTQLLDQISTWLENHLRDEQPAPRLYPTPEGGVEAEWLIGRLDLSIEFEPNSNTVQWHAMDLDQSTVEEDTVPLHDFAKLQALGQRLEAALAASESVASGVRVDRLECGGHGWEKAESC